MLFKRFHIALFYDVSEKFQFLVPETTKKFLVAHVRTETRVV